MATAEELLLVSQRRQVANGMNLDVVQVQQWLTDISATRGFEGFDDGFGEAENFAKLFVTESAKLRELFAGTEWDPKIAKLQTDFEGFYDMGKKMGQVYIDEGPEEGNKMMEKFDPYAAQIGEGLEEIVGFTGDELNRVLTGLESQSATSRMVGIAMMLIGTTIGIVISLLIVTNVRKRLTVICKNMISGAKEVSSASGMISSSSQSLADGATHQASSVQGTTTAMEQISASAKQNAENAKGANDIIVETEAMVSRGVESMKQMTTAMDSIKESSAEISKIIKVIEEIAFQTNLLALNAAVEAARAGEHGKGFAVVAEEVRNLAQRSATASKDTSELISSAVKRSNEGGGIAQKAAEDLGEIADGIKKARINISEITSASQEQASGVENVNSSIMDIDRVTQSTAADSEEAAAASEELNAQSEKLFDMVETLTVIVGIDLDDHQGERAGKGRGAFTVEKRPQLPSPTGRGNGPTNGRNDGKARPAVSSSGKNRAHSKNAIPFDDDSFDDF
jgi:methyl-accepting chemotaxis protein